MNNKEDKEFLKGLFLEHICYLPDEEKSLASQFSRNEMGLILEDILEATDFYGEGE